MSETVKRQRFKVGDWVTLQNPTWDDPWFFLQYQTTAQVIAVFGGGEGLKVELWTSPNDRHEYAVPASRFLLAPKIGQPQ